VFAPVNSAFAAIEETVATLSTEQVATVLLYHCVGAEFQGQSAPLHRRTTVIRGAAGRDAPFG
jgi:uncharacterized surface protein with fasciclin (FAS1) repeats